MFLGEYQHTLDTKGRVILPAKFREQLGDGAVIAKTRERCLAIYPPDEWEKVAQRTRELAAQSARHRQAARSLFAGASEVNPDRQGRIAVPPHLREYAVLDRDVVLTGAFSHIEVWNAEAWERENAEGDVSLAEAEDMPELGM